MIGEKTSLGSNICNFYYILLLSSNSLLRHMLAVAIMTLLHWDTWKELLSEEDPTTKRKTNYVP